MASEVGVSTFPDQEIVQKVTHEMFKMDIK